MKTFVAISAVLAVLSLDQASAMKSFLKNFPNGDLAFTQGLGHVSDSDTGLNDFGKLYSSKDGKWADLCKEKFPGKDFTVGAAFGDPCCKWTSGAADFKVTPFTVPTKGEVCAADKPATPAASSAAPAPAPAPAATPAPAGAATPAPAGKPATPAASPAAGKDTPVVTPAPAGKPVPAPAGKPDAGKPAGGKPSKCGVKKEAKSLEDENDDDEDVFNYED